MAQNLSFLSEAPDEQAVAICRQFVRTRSVNPPGDEEAIAVLAAGMLAQAGLTVELVPHGPGRASVLARLRGAGHGPGLLFSAHLDTVAAGSSGWSHDPFGAELSQGRIWGRGAADMKGGLAAMIVAARTLAQEGAPLSGDLVLALTAGEEVNCMGAMALAARPDLGPVQAVVVAEPSGNDLYIAEKGALWLELTTHGHTAHGSMPEVGRNAVMMMVSLLAELDRLPIPHQRHDLLGEFTCSINTVAGGQKTNVVPDHCSATVDMRTVPGQDHAAIVAAVRELIGSLAARKPGFQATVRVVDDHPPVCTDPSDPVVELFATVIGRVTGRRPVPQGVRYFTDAVAFVPALKAPLIICGPGPAAMAHQPDEYVEVDRLVESVRILTGAAREMLGAPA